ncbi:copper chaperone PCu(A)C [Hyphomonas sp.]|uniref:copper chaperone PCu(A)C n=1 Tax=Hyphomonas sp. TaxID=87 RepID=UPI0025B83599|nr:copper chaperone PCu(A)C [Hyphomonas sp.]
MRVSLITAASLSALLLAACAPANEQPAGDAAVATVEAEAVHDDHAGMHGDDMGSAADAPVDRGIIAGTLALVEGSLLMPPAGRDVTAGFGTFAAGARPVTIIAAEAPFAQAVELHTHEMSADGKMAMRKVDAFTVPANGDHSLTRGGDHLMFFGVQPDSLTPGTAVTVTVRVQFEDGTTEDVDVPLTVAARD